MGGGGGTLFLSFLATLVMWFASNVTAGAPLIIHRGRTVALVRAILFSISRSTNFLFSFWIRYRSTEELEYPLDDFVRNNVVWIPDLPSICNTSNHARTEYQVFHPLKYFFVTVLMISKRDNLRPIFLAISALEEE